MTRSERSVVKGHLSIIKLLREEGPLRTGEVENKLGSPRRTIEDRLRRLYNMHEIQKLPDGRYASLEFVSIEDKIEEFFREKYGGEIPNRLRINENMIKILAIQLGQDINDDKFIGSIRSFSRKFGIPLLHDLRTREEQ